ncbi:hypothetical protein EYC80_004879 [Monilinia laxa]|uniref:Uncharacterized protein n=1 Tax=Monilinia laxa TaxID=61186 RepID=A0A5N6KIE6_MONLA|nr:hypothetical protein EYC80_004879 [Monilinia laxa]
MLQNELERTTSTISAMQHDVLKTKEENKEAEKKIKDYQQKINTLALARDVLKESHASNAAEIRRLEEKIKSVETYKQATEKLIECYKDTRYAFKCNDAKRLLGAPAITP